LLSDDYFPSDLAWLDLKDPKIDIISLPTKTYLDNLLGIKGSYGTAILIRNETESKKLEVYEKYVPDLQEFFRWIKPTCLPSAAHHAYGSHGRSFRTGDLLHGYQAVADNLPNDARVHAQKAAKKSSSKFHGRTRQRSHPSYCETLDACRPGRKSFRRRIPSNHADA